MYRAYTALSIAILIGYICVTSTIAYAAADKWQASLMQADACVSRRELSKAEQIFKQAFAQTNQGLHTAEDKSKCLNSLANVLALEGKTGEAETTLFKSLSLLEKAYGKNSSKLVPTLLEIGSVYESMGNHAFAMRFYSKATAINEQNYGPYCPAFSSEASRLDSRKKILKLGVDGDYGLSGSASKQQAGLEASEQLKGALPAFSSDILKYNCTSDEDLLTDFKHDTESKRSN